MIELEDLKNHEEVDIDIYEYKELEIQKRYRINFILSKYIFEYKRI